MKRYKVIDTDCEADVWFDNVENKPLDYKDIEKILEKQCSQWQKLKEWIEEREKKHTLMLKASAFEDIEILNKMRELEGEDE